jgi:hypothetical protein
MGSSATEVTYIAVMAKPNRVPEKLFHLVGFAEKIAVSP